MNTINSSYPETITIEDNYDDCNYMYGGGDYVIDDKDIELLKQGKIINFTVNEEYGCTLAYKQSEEVDE